ncbi:MAG: hypothetical protein ACUVWB_03810, partial [Anaerolineae bacterium]
PAPSATPSFPTTPTEMPLPAEPAAPAPTRPPTSPAPATCLPCAPVFIVLGLLLMAAVGLLRSPGLLDRKSRRPLTPADWGNSTTPSDEEPRDEHMG